MIDAEEVLNIIGRQTPTQTGVENHALRWKVHRLEALVRAYLKVHGEDCVCELCARSRKVLAETIIDIFLHGRTP